MDPKTLVASTTLLAAIAALLEPSTENALGDALALLAAVDVGCVEELDAQFQGLVHDGKAVGFGGAGAEVHRTQAQAGNLQAGAAECRVLHAASSFRLSGRPLWRVPGMSERHSSARITVWAAESSRQNWSAAIAARMCGIDAG